MYIKRLVKYSHTIEMEFILNVLVNQFALLRR